MPLILLKEVGPCLLWTGAWGIQFSERQPENVAAVEDDTFMMMKEDSSKFMASLPWVDTIKTLTPSEYATTRPTAK